MTITRRDFLVTGTAGACLAAAATPALAAASAPRTRRLRIAHLTDIHLQPELEAARGFAACLAHVQTRPTAVGGDSVDTSPPDLIITGGDTIMDAFEADMARTKLQWELWRKLKADHCGLEMHSVVGNHMSGAGPARSPAPPAPSRSTGNGGCVTNSAGSCLTRALIEAGGTWCCSTASFPTSRAT